MTDESSLPIDRRTLASLRAALEDTPVIVEVRFGERTDPPERLVFYRYELLIDYLRMLARPGDRIAAWRFDEACREENALVRPSVLRRPGDA